MWKTKLLIVLLSFLCIGHVFGQYIDVDSLDSEGNVIKMKVNNKTGSPHRIYGLKINLKKYGDLNDANMEKIGKEFLKEYRKMLKIKPSDFKLQKSNFYDKFWHVRFQQTYKDVNIHLAEVIFTVHENGNVVILGSNAHNNISMNVKPNISPEEALEIAKTHFIALTQIDTVVIGKNPELLILPIEGEYEYTYRLCYNMQLGSIIDSREYYIDAHNGEIVIEGSNVKRLENTISGKVQIYYYEQEPVSSDLRLGPLKEGKINLYDYNTDNYLRYVLTDNNGNYTFDNLSEENDYKIEAVTEGQWVIAMPPVNYPIIPIWTRLPYGTGFKYSEISPGDIFNIDIPTFSATQPQTNIYYHIDKAHYYYANTLGAYEMNFQMVSKYFIDPGLQAKATSSKKIIGDVAILFGTNDDNFDGIPEQWAMSSDAIYHEYGHTFIYKINDGKPLDWTYSNDIAAGMEEGIPDYFACSMNDHPILCPNFVSVNRNLVNQLKWDINPPTYIYEIGRLIGGALWDLRELMEPIIGVIEFDKKVILAVRNNICVTTLDVFAGDLAIMLDNDNDPSNGNSYYA